MADDGVSGERFTERELALILKRAAELEGHDAADSLVHYTLADAQEIAAGAGIDAASVATAAAELRRPAQSVPWLLGGPTRFRAERTSPVVVPPAAFADLVDAIRLETALQGQSAQMFDGLEWRGQGFGGFVFVTISPRARDTRVTVSAARTDEAILAGAAGGGAAIAAIAVSVALLVSLGVPPVVIAGVASIAAGTALVATTRAIWRRKAERWTRRTAEIANAIARRVSELAAKDHSS